jgi:hypothetical protein
MKVENVLYAIVGVLWCTITILLHKIGNVNLVAWYCLATPLVAVRLYKAYLEIQIWKSKK